MSKRRRKDLQFWESTEMNNRTYLHYYDRGMELAISRFEYKNLPDSLDERFIELTLYSKGASVWFKDENLDMPEPEPSSNVIVLGNNADPLYKDNLTGKGSVLALPMITNGRLDIYNRPLVRRAIANNGYNSGDLTPENSVIMYGNYLRKPIMRDIELYARWLYDIQQSIIINAKAQKTPVAVLCDETERLTMINLYKEYDGNAPFIFGTKNLDINQLKAIQTLAPYVADKLSDLKISIWNEMLTFLGISNINVVKKERLITDEVTRNQGGVMASRFSPLGMRQQAVKEINAKFGLNISVDYRQDYQELVEDATEDVIGEDLKRQKEAKGGTENE